MYGRALAVACLVGLTAILAGNDYWLKLEPATAPSPRSAGTLTNVDGRLFYYGGTAARELWEWTGSTWVKLNPSGTLPDVFWFHSALAYQGKLYIMFGYDEFGQASAGIWTYDPVSNAWAVEFAPQAAVAHAKDGEAPVARGSVSVTRWGDRFYISGGADSSGVLREDASIYNTQTGRWEPVPDMPYAVGGAAAIECNGKFYIILGETLTGPNRDLIVHDYLQGTWQRKQIAIEPGPGPTVAPAVRPMVLARSGGSLIIGGEWEMVPVAQSLDFECVTETLSFRDPMPSAAGGMAGAPYPPNLPTPTPGPQWSSGGGSEVGALMFGGLRPGLGFTNDTYYYAGQVSVDSSATTWLAAAAQIRGRTNFRSRVNVANVGLSPIVLSMSFTPRRDIGGTPVGGTRTVDPGVMATTENVLFDWLNLSHDTVGSLRFEVTSGNPADLKVQSVISAHNDDGTEFGQFFKGIPSSEGLVAGQSAYFATTENPVRYRTNLGLCSFEDGTVMVVQPVAPIGSALAAAEQFSLDRGENVQLNDIYARWNLATSQLPALVKLSVVEGSGAGYVSVLDGNGSYVGTNDPATIWAYTLGAPRVTLLEVGPVQGLNEFSGSALLTNFGLSGPAVVDVDFYERGSTAPARHRTVNVSPGGTLGWEDVVGELFGETSAVGTLVFSQVAGGPQSHAMGTMLATSGIAATGREYSIQRNAQREIVGTAGQLMPGLTDSDRLQPGTTYHLLGLVQTGTTSGTERSHLAMFNPGSSDITLTATLFDGDTAAMEGQKSWTVRDGELKQVNFVVGDIYPAQDGSPKRLEVTVSGPVFVAAFRVNKDGDPVTIEPLGP